MTGVGQAPDHLHGPLSVWWNPHCGIDSMGVAIQGMDRYGGGDGMWVKQQPKLLEAVTGCEAKNTYRGWSTTPNTDKEALEMGGVNQTVYVHEESTCFQRVCCGPGRELTLIARTQDRQADRASDEFMRMHKPWHCAGDCCCCRPKFEVTAIFPSDGQVEESRGTSR